MFNKCFQLFCFGVLVLFIPLLFSCNQAERSGLEQSLDSLSKTLNYAEESMAVDPDLLKIRVDSMAIKIKAIENSGISLEPESSIGHAMGYYRTAMMVFRFYVENHSVLQYENQRLSKVVERMETDLAVAGERDINKLAVEINTLRPQVFKHKKEVQALIRQYIDIVRPYNRVKEQINQNYKALSSD